MSFLKNIKLFIAAFFFLGSTIASAAGDVTVSVGYSHFLTQAQAYQSVSVSYGVNSDWSVYVGVGSDWVAKQLAGTPAEDAEAPVVEEADTFVYVDQMHVVAGAEYTLLPNSEVTPVFGVGVRYEKASVAEVPVDRAFYNPMRWWVAVYNTVGDWYETVDTTVYYAYVNGGLDWNYEDFNVGFDVSFNFPVQSDAEVSDDDDSEEAGSVFDEVGIQANLSVGYVF